jgi:hypothetical protein
MREIKRERFQRQVNTEDTSTISWVLGGLSVYFVLYLWLRDSSASIIPSFVIIALLCICLSIIVTLKIKYLLTKFLLRVFKKPSKLVKQPVTAYDMFQQQTFNAPYNRHFTYNPVVLGSVMQPQEGRNGMRSPDYLLRNQIPFVPPYNETPTLAQLPSERPKSFTTCQTDYETLSNNSLALEFYERMGIKQRISIWVENVRYWLSYTLIPTVLKRHQQNLEQLTKFLGFYNRTLIFNRLDDYPMTNLSPTLWEDLYTSIMNSSGSTLQGDKSIVYMMMNNEQSRNDLIKLLKERANIEKYLRLKDNSSTKREYVLERLKKLQVNFTGEYNNTSCTSSIVKDSEVT